MLRQLGITVVKGLLFVWAFVWMILLAGWPLFLVYGCWDVDPDNPLAKIFFAPLYLAYMTLTALEGGKLGKGMAMVWEALMLPFGDPRDADIG